MASIEERLQIKREPIDKWSIREQLCLASARINDQNLTSVSRALKPFGEPNRPADWFNQKNCAAQYGALLANVETPKRKKRTSGPEAALETPAETILRKLLNERKAELKKLLAEEKAEYCKLQEDMALLQGNVSEEQLDIWCREIDEEEQKRDQELIAHTQWLRERELRKQEIERVWRPVKPLNVVSQKRKNSETLESVNENTDSSGSHQDEQKSQTSGQTEQAKPALSPLLTSLLKSPSQVPNVATSSILHSAITNQNQAHRTQGTNSNTNPMIASLLSTSSNPTAVSPGIQQLVTSAIGQETEGAGDPAASQSITTNDILDDTNLPMVKIDDLANSILIEGGPLPEMKHDVDVIISDLIENAQDIVADPEQHLQLDGNGDISIGLELDELDEEEMTKSEQPQSTPSEPSTASVSGDTETSASNTPKTSDKVVDPFEFQEDPVYQPSNKSLPSTSTPPAAVAKITTPTPVKEAEPLLSPVVIEEDLPETTAQATDLSVEKDQEIETKLIEDTEKAVVEDDKSEEIVKVEELSEDEDAKKPLSEEPVKTEAEIEADEEKENAAWVSLIKQTLEVDDLIEKSPEEDKTTVDETPEIKQEPEDGDSNINLVESKPSDTTVTIPDLEELYDDHMEVRIDKTGKAKRDYSRTKKKEDREFDVLLALEKSHPQDLCGDMIAEDLSDNSDQKDFKTSKLLKQDYDGGSCTSWDDDDKSYKRRLSTPATFVDSVPDSPSSSIYDDDRDYKAWKKSAMLVYNRLSTNKYASIFAKPITDDQAPGYHSIVYRPMDLQTIRRNIESGVIRTTQEFQRDVLLMLNNAVMYNKTNQTVYKMALDMQQEAIQEIHIFVQAQTQQGDFPVRRETRTSEPGTKRKRVGDDLGRGLKKRKDD